MTKRTIPPSVIRYYGLESEQNIAGINLELRLKEFLLHQHKKYIAPFPEVQAKSILLKLAEKAGVDLEEGSLVIPDSHTYVLGKKTPVIALAVLYSDSKEFFPLFANNAFRTKLLVKAASPTLDILAGYFSGTSVKIKESKVVTTASFSMAVRPSSGIKVDRDAYLVDCLIKQGRFNGGAYTQVRETSNYSPQVFLEVIVSGPIQPILDFRQYIKSGLYKDIPLEKDEVSFR